MPPPLTRRSLLVVATLLLTAGTATLGLLFGLPPVLIVGVPGVASLLFWARAYLPAPTPPGRVLPPFLLCGAGFALHAIEEALGHYGPAVGRLFGFAWTDAAFSVAVFALLAALGGASLGLLFKVRLAGFVAILFVATRFAEIALFVFPLLRPALHPEDARTLSLQVGETLVREMPNYALAVRGTYYFPGMLTVVLPLVPAVFVLREIWLARPRNASAEPNVRPLD